jgi:hypothetical protein
MGEAAAEAAALGPHARGGQHGGTVHTLLEAASVVGVAACVCVYVYVCVFEFVCVCLIVFLCLYM